MITLSKTKEWITQRLSKGGLSAGEHPMFLPGRDWKIMVMGFFAVSFIVAGLATYMFFQVQERSFFSQQEEERKQPPLRLQKNELANTVEYYEQRRDRFDSFRNNPPATFDPS